MKIEGHDKMVSPLQVANMSGLTVIHVISMAVE